MAERKPRLFYLEESIPAWVPAPEHIENIIELADMDAGETQVVEFRRVDLTDAEYKALPDSDEEFNNIPPEIADGKGQ